MNQYCIPIAIDLYPLIKDIREYQRIPYQNVSVDNINPKLISFFNELKISLIGFSIFYKPASSLQIKPHSDFEGGDYVKLNFVYGGKNSKMIWYRVKNNIQDHSTYITGNTGLHTSYNFSDVEKVYEHHVGCPSIVQVGVPHSILNTEEPRWCLSMVMVDDRGEKIPMQEIKNILQL
jgi:hypothetical protein